jgi:hypothetical protein
MNRVASVMVMHARDRATWFAIPWGVLGVGFAVCLFIALAIVLLFGSTSGTYTAIVGAFYMVMLMTGISAVVRAFPFAVGFSARRKDFVLGTLATGVAASAAWAILLGLLSLFEANVIKDWGVGLHFFYLPVFSDSSPLRRICWSHDTDCALSDPNYLHGGLSLGQFWVYFVLLLFMFLLGLLLGSIYQRFGRIGEYILAGIAFLLLSGFLLLGSYWNWWGVIFGWLGQQSAATLSLWLLPLIALFAIVSYALLRKATV